ncbi:hypothetical protein HOLleu_33123 [Holothuria leucospilota]|uniref:WAP domain-containing protein n=1 Tax=Holothuria leucospilota TaxID=206669 RepID=A0A9Q1BF73_HOLLE|nr:hypothetical protein HOLleu_33123 [Holothuria leucospilota]
MELLLRRVGVIIFLHLIISVTYTGSFLQLTETTCLDYQECVQDSDCPEQLVCGCSAKCGKICKAREEDDTEVLEAKRRAYKIFGITVSCDTFPDCSQDTDCSQGQKCGCHDLCGAKCLSKRKAPPEHAGQCPEVPTLFPCYNSCEYDYHCQTNEKCCPTLCSGKKCRTAALETPSTTMVPSNSSTSPMTSPNMQQDTLLKDPISNVSQILNTTEISNTTPQSVPNHKIRLHRYLGLPTPVCGSNGLTFHSISQLRKVNLTAHEPIHIAYPGPCRRPERCRGPACSKGPRLHWILVNGTIQGYFRDHSQKLQDDEVRSTISTDELPSIPQHSNNSTAHL